MTPAQAANRVAEAIEAQYEICIPFAARDLIRDAILEERAAFPSELRSRWEACGPWVADEDLTEEGLADKRLFLELLADRRLQS